MQNSYLFLVCILTLFINIIGISALSARIVGTRTRRLASSISLFNIIVLFAQFSNTIQAPLLTKFIESNISIDSQSIELVFRIIIFSGTIGATLGAILIPTAHRFMEKGVKALYQRQSVFAVVIASFNKSTIIHAKNSFTLPRKNNFFRLLKIKDINKSIVLLNVVVYSFSTVSVLSCLYAGFLLPSLRLTALSMSGIANGISSLGMLLFIEPYNAILTDKVIEGSITEGYFRKHLTWVVFARILGTIFAQIVFIPLALFINKLVVWF